MRVSIIIAFFCFLGSLHAQISPKFPMKVKPNPANQRTAIEFPANIDINQCQVQLFSLFGTPVSGIYVQSQPYDHKVQLHFPDVPEGIYVIRIKHPDFEYAQRLKIQR